MNSRRLSWPQRVWGLAGAGGEDVLARVIPSILHESKNYMHTLVKRTIIIRARTTISLASASFRDGT